MSKKLEGKTAVITIHANHADRLGHELSSHHQASTAVSLKGW